MFVIKEKDAEPFFEKEIYPTQVIEYYVIAGKNTQGEELYLNIETPPDCLYWEEPKYLEIVSKFESLEEVETALSVISGRLFTFLHAGTITELYYKLITEEIKIETLKGGQIIQE